MEIIGLDYPCIDLNLICSHAPGEGEWVQMEDMSLEGGGKVPNALCAAARLGASCGMIGVAGDDRYGRLCRDDLAAHGVDVSRLRLAEGHTAFCVSIVSTGAKRYIESVKTHRSLAADEVEEGYVASAKVLLLYLMDEAAIAAARYAKAHDVTVAIDADEFDERTIRYLPMIDVLIASEYFYRNLFPAGGDEENLRKLSTMGPGIVIVTLGERGSMGVERGNFFRTDAFPVNGAKDTTGCGDAFHGAFCRCLARGMGAPEAARFSSAVSAIKCRISGGRAGLPDERAVLRFLETGETDLSPLLARESAYRDAAWT